MYFAEQLPEEALNLGRNVAALNNNLILTNNLGAVV